MNTILFLSLSVLGADPEPRLQFEKTSVDRGEVRSGVPLVETFQLKNPTGTSVTVTALTGSCGCLKPKISTPVILPGETAEVRFEVNTLTQPAGPNRWKSMLRYRAEGGKEVEQPLELVASVKREVRVEPSSLIVVTTEPITRTFTLFDDRVGRGLGIREVKSSIPHLKATNLLNETYKKFRSSTIQVELKDDCPPGDYPGFLSILTDDPDYGEIRVPLQIIKRSAKEVQASPDELSLRFTADQKTVSGIVRLKDGEDREVIVEKAEADHPSISTKHVPGPGKMSTLRISVHADPASGHGEGIVRVTLKSPEPKVVVIPVRWE